MRHQAMLGEVSGFARPVLIPPVADANADDANANADFANANADFANADVAERAMAAPEPRALTPPQPVAADPVGQIGIELASGVRMTGGLKTALTHPPLRPRLH